MEEESQMGRNSHLDDVWLKKLPPKRSPIFGFIDLFVRIVAGVAIIPLAIVSLFVAIMAGDAPNSGVLPGILVLTAGAGISTILFLSCVMPDAISAKLGRFQKYGRVIARAPAYLYAPFGIYYGERVIAGILVNVVH